MLRWRGPSRTSDGAAWHWACSGAAPGSSRERALGEARGLASASPSRWERRSRAAVFGSRTAMESDAFGRQESRAPAHRDGTSRDESPSRGSRSVRAQRCSGGERLDPRLRRSPACFDGSSRVGKDFPRLHPLRRLHPRTSASGDALTGRRKRDLVLLRPTPKYEPTIRPFSDRYKQILDRAPAGARHTRPPLRPAFLPAPRQYRARAGTRQKLSSGVRKGAGSLGEGNHAVRNPSRPQP